VIDHLFHQNGEVPLVGAQPSRGELFALHLDRRRVAIANGRRDYVTLLESEELVEGDLALRKANAELHFDAVEVLGQLEAGTEPFQG